MGTKNSYGSVGRGDTLNFRPEDLKVVTDPKHPLYDPRIEREPDEGMVLSIMKHGVLVPAIIYRDGEGVFVDDGRQRRACSIEANKRLVKEGKKPVVIPCVWKRGDEKTLFGISVATNEVRFGDSPLERARKMQRLADFCGGDLNQVAVDFGCTTATVKNTLALLECAPQVQKAVETGKLPAIVATKMSKMSKDEQVTTLDKMVEAGATKGERAHKAVKKKGDVAAKTKAISNKTRTRVLEMIESVPYQQKDDTMVTIIATLNFVGGDPAAFKKWPHIENLVAQALMSAVKEKKLKVKKEKKPKAEKKPKKARSTEKAPEQAVA